MLLPIGIFVASRIDARFADFELDSRPGVRRSIYTHKRNLCAMRRCRRMSVNGPADAAGDAGRVSGMPENLIRATRQTSSPIIAALSLRDSAD